MKCLARSGFKEKQANRAALQIGSNDLQFPFRGPYSNNKRRRSVRQQRISRSAHFSTETEQNPKPKSKMAATKIGMMDAAYFVGRGRDPGLD
ncbi:hypothetical protein HPP92_028522 [Vanilla planifolia]|uniref:Uncharacterized protein n=1 Tax=Vanilla planifolia TaxID=51239 RepID=A0A835U2F0_VANPL|nr:hypothetical protein HPP92_028522 [Vanilla planifolia]